MKHVLCCIGLHDYVPVSWLTCQPNNIGSVCRRCLAEKPTIDASGDQP